VSAGWRSPWASASAWPSRAWSRLGRGGAVGVAGRGLRAQVREAAAQGSGAIGRQHLGELALRQVEARLGSRGTAVDEQPLGGIEVLLDLTGGGL
jgi:hypothetical protein